MASKIEWLARPGTIPVSWNVVTGCTRCSPGCLNCYAERMSKRLAGRAGYPEAPHNFDVTLHEDRLGEPFTWRKPRTVFVVSMGDLFHDSVPETYQLAVWGIMKACPQHLFIVLSKRAQLMKYRLECYVYPLIAPLPNVWLGVTAENQEQVDKRIPVLLQIPAAVHFVSVEPMLSEIEIHEYLPMTEQNRRLWQEAGCKSGMEDGRTLSFVIVGAETGPGKRQMKDEWARDLRNQCYAAGVPFFFKKNNIGEPYLDEVIYHEWPEVANVPTG